MRSRRRSSTAATATAMYAAVRHGRTRRRGLGADDPRAIVFARGCLLLPSPDPVPGRAQAVLELDHRAEAELARCQLGVEEAPLQLAEPRRCVLGGRVGAGDARAERVELDDGGLASGADVEDAALLPEPRTSSREPRRRRRRSRASAARRRRSSPARRGRARRGRSRRRPPRRAGPGAARRRSRSAARRASSRRGGCTSGGTPRPRAWRCRTGRAGSVRRVLARGFLALAVDRAARRAEDDLRAVRGGRPRGSRTVPMTFDLGVLDRRSTETRTSAWAARWNTASGRTSSKRSSSGSRMSRTWSSAPAGDVLLLPWTSESTTATSSPRATSASTTCEPMKPAPPVTIARTDASYGRP